MLVNKFKCLIRRWKEGKDGTAAIEAALVFPLLIFLLLGTYDMGNAIITDQKVIRASQVVGDLVTREETVSDADLNEYIYAGQLALVPQSTASFGVDIVSISFDAASNPTIVWRETRNMTENPDVLADVASLAEPNGGVVVTTVQYTFYPLFGNFIVGDIAMQEVAFTKGRKSAVVNKV